jgi:hypothetical protein
VQQAHANAQQVHLVNGQHRVATSRRCFARANVQTQLPEPHQNTECCHVRNIVRNTPSQAPCRQIFGTITCT